LTLRLGNLKLDRSIVVAILAVGTPSFAAMIGASLVNAVINNRLAGYGGVLDITAMGLLYTIVLMIATPVFGLNQGAQPLIGYNYGAGQFERVRKTMAIAIALGVGVTASGFAIMMLFPGPVFSIFCPHDDRVVALATKAARTSLMMLPLVGFQIVGTSYFQAVGRTVVALLLTISRQILLLIPALVILPILLGVQGVWLAIPLSDLCSAVLTGVLLAAEFRRLRRVEHCRVLTA
jgi:Na+-driven multidrug efflux pump